MKKICVVTTTRADYGILLSPIKAILKSKDLELILIVTGTHLSTFYGNTIEAIKSDNIPISACIDINLTAGDRPKDIAGHMANALKAFAEYFQNDRPDLVMLVGDRYEVFSIAQSAIINNIPIAHLHGGEITEGAIDEYMRHAITKMAHYHFTSNIVHQNRVIQMGECPKNVYNVGAAGLDCIKNLNLLTRSQLESDLKIQFKKHNLLITFHPLTINEEINRKEVVELFKALEGLDRNWALFFTMPNADTYSSNIISELRKFSTNRENVHIFSSMGQLRYLSMMNEVDCVLGNSSSGIIEAPFLNKAVVNIGMRQKGRMQSEHVIQVDADNVQILNAINKAVSPEFRASFKTKGFYGDGNTSERIVKILKELNLNKVQTKSFYDLEGNAHE